jgi:hypothetical protein
MRTSKLFGPLLVWLCTVVATIALASCSSNMAQRYGGTVSAMRQLDVGMSRDQVVSLLGSPDGVHSSGSDETLNYYQRFPDIISETPADYFVTLNEGRVVRYGQVPGSRKERSNITISANSSSSQTTTGGMTCMKKGEARTGFTKQCAYGCLSNTVIETISHTQLCPLTIQR